MKTLMILFLLVVGFTTVTLAQSKKAEVKIKTSAVCNMCKKTIERDLSYEKGVKESSLDVESQVLTVVYNPEKTDVEKIRKALTNIGYDADSLTANPKAYDNLDDCCKKEMGVHAE